MELTILETLSESRSAKAYGRPVFNQLLERIENGEADGIICWKLDRLARNFIDGGRIIDMLQHGKIKVIQTHDRQYLSNDNVLMMAMEFGMANQFIRDLSTNTRRGLRNKVSMGWLPHRAPIGYLNDKTAEQGDKKIFKDPDRFNMVRKMWDLLLVNKFSIEQIYRKAVDEWGLTLAPTKKTPAHKPCRSKIYHTFINPFYYGYFYYNGQLHKGTHEAMITEKEFDDAQVILGLKTKPRLRTHQTTYAGTLKCTCGSSIVAEHKTKNQKNGNTHRYIYYRCSRSKDPKCKQIPVTENTLETQIVSLLNSIEIPASFCDWALELLRADQNKENEVTQMIVNNHRLAYDKCTRRINSLIDMRANGEISESEFSTKKAEASDEKLKVEKLLHEAEANAVDWFGKAEEIISFARDARRAFEAGTPAERRLILITLGLNLQLQDGRLTVELQKPLSLIQEVAQDVKTVSEPLEPVLDRRKVGEIYAKNVLWGG